MNLFYFLKILILSFVNLSSKDNNEEKARLKKPVEKKKLRITPELILIIIVILLFITIPLLVYSSGCLDSTNYYNGRLI